MTPNELIDIIRSEYLDEFLDDAASEGVREAAVKNKTPFLRREIATGQRRACQCGDMRYIFDDSTAAVCTVTLVADTQTYALHSSILTIDHATFDGDLLPMTNRATLDATRQGWRDYSTCEPANYYIEGRTLFLDRAPSTAEDGETISLSVWREPVNDPEENTELEIADPEPIAHWVAHRAFMRPNQDKQRHDLAKFNLEQFHAHYGKHNGALVRRHMLETPPSINFTPLHPARSPGVRRDNFEYLNGDC